MSSFRYAPIFDQWELFARLRSTNVQVHALWGDADDVVDTEIVGGNLKQALPDMQLSIIQGAGHDVCTSKPAEVVEHLLRILKT